MRNYPIRKDSLRLILDLELGKVHADLILCYKILHDMADIDTSNTITFDTTTRCTRGHGLKLRAVKPNSNIVLNSYAYRVTTIWNSLSANTVWAHNLASFKNYLYIEDLTDALL